MTGPSSSPSTTAINNTDLLTGPSSSNPGTNPSYTVHKQMVFIDPNQYKYKHLLEVLDQRQRFLCLICLLMCSHVFFTNDLIDKIVVQTNLYASQVMTEESFSNREKTTVEELKAYFGFYILTLTAPSSFFNNFKLNVINRSRDRG